VDEFDEEIIRKIIHNFSNIRIKRPTMAAVFQAVKEEGIRFTGKINSFRKLTQNGISLEENARQPKMFN
jgi:hypothetical protein